MIRKGTKDEWEYGANSTTVFPLWGWADGSSHGSFRGEPQSETDR